MPRLQPLLCRIALLSLLGGGAAAQDDRSAPPPGPRSEPLPPPHHLEPQRAEKQPWIGDDGRQVPYVPDPAAPGATDATRPMLDSLCSFDCSTRPGLLNPGDSGTLYVIATLQDLVVLTASSGFELQYAPVQQHVRLGHWRLPPPPARALVPGFGNQPVYRDTAIVEIPVSVDADAEPGLHQVSLTCSTELHDGDAGRSLGRYQRELVIGIAVRGSATAAAATPIVSQVLTPTPTPSRAEPPPTPPPPAIAPEDPLPLLLAGAGALLLLGGLLFWRRRR